MQYYISFMKLSVCEIHVNSKGKLAVKKPDSHRLKQVIKLTTSKRIDTYCVSPRYDAWRQKHDFLTLNKFEN